MRHDDGFRRVFRDQSDAQREHGSQYLKWAHEIIAGWERGDYKVRAGYLLACKTLDVIPVLSKSRYVGKNRDGWGE